MKIQDYSCGYFFYDGILHLKPFNGHPLEAIDLTTFEMFIFDLDEEIIVAGVSDSIKILSRFL